ncbi:MAG: NAD-dependent protein deacylase [Pseudomonadales bacterium]|nr:NAD-dependent protein deacylase [Pseudomonadales bacterium]
MRRYSSIVVLTGAGISAESGIQTFRGGGGLWEGHDIEEVATFDGYVRNPRKVLSFYNDRRRDLRRAGIEPNAAHLALAEFERNHPGEFLLVTQNVDDLHERAGSRELRHMHGELDKVRCQRCHQVYSSREDIEPSTQCPWCMAAGRVRPHIVWFGEMPFHMDEIHLRLARCDLFVSIGTSGNVYPAAGFVELAHQRGITTVELNLEPSEGAALFSEGHYGPATTIVPEFFARLRQT